MQLKIRAASSDEIAVDQVDAFSACIVSLAVFAELKNGSSAELAVAIVSNMRGSDASTRLVSFVGSSSVHGEDVILAPLVSWQLSLPPILSALKTESLLHVTPLLPAQQEESVVRCKQVLLRRLHLTPESATSDTAAAGDAGAAHASGKQAQEDAAIQRFFLLPRLLAVGDCVCIASGSASAAPAAAAGSTEQITYWYTIEEVQTNKKQVMDKHLIRTVPGFTSVAAATGVQTLGATAAGPPSGRPWSRRRLPDMVHMAQLARWEHAYFRTDTRRVAMGGIITASGEQTSWVAQVQAALIPALGLVHLPEALQRSLQEIPLLVDMAQAPLVDLKAVLTTVAARLGMPLYALDARLLWQYEERRLQQAQGLTSAAVSSTACGTMQSILATCVSPAAVTANAPCVMYIEGLDAMLLDVAGTDQRGGSSCAAKSLADSLQLFLKDIYMDCAARRSVGEEESSAGPDGGRNVVLAIAASAAAKDMHEAIRAVFPAELALAASEAASTLPHPNSLSSEVQNFAKRAASSFGGGDLALQTVLTEAEHGALERRRARAWLSAAGLGATGQKYQPDNGEELKQAHIETAVEVVTSRLAGTTTVAPALSAVSPVYWADIGGLANVRKEILDVIQLPLQHPELFPPGCPARRAVMLFGAPGTGKTLVARAVATECGLSFLNVKGPELLDIYVGESERNVRNTFAKARAAAPCVLFFDELDSLAPARGRGADGGGVMDRVVAQLLTEMDALAGAPSGEQVFVLAATNRPDLLDGALLRPGRFDRCVYLPACKDCSTREAILQAQTRKLHFGADVSLANIAKSLPDCVTGADISSVVSTAVSRARRRLLKSLQLEAAVELGHSRADQTVKLASSEAETDDDDDDEDEEETWAAAAYINRLPSSRLKVRLTSADFEAAVQALRPSVTFKELEHYEALASTYGERDEYV